MGSTNNMAAYTTAPAAIRKKVQYDTLRTSSESTDSTAVQRTTGSQQFRSPRNGAAFTPGADRPSPTRYAASPSRRGRLCGKPPCPLRKRGGTPPDGGRRPRGVPPSSASTYFRGHCGSVVRGQDETLSPTVATHGFRRIIERIVERLNTAADYEHCAKTPLRSEQWCSLSRWWWW